MQTRNAFFVQNKTKSGTLMRVYTLPGKKAQGEFALELSTRAIDWYNEWFGITYPIPKCDLIAIPDFSMGTFYGEPCKFLFRSYGKLGSCHLS